MAIGAKLGKFRDKVILIQRRPLTGSNHSDGKYACLYNGWQLMPVVTFKPSTFPHKGNNLLYIKKMNLHPRIQPVLANNLASVFHQCDVRNIYD